MFNQPIFWETLSSAEQQAILQRPAMQDNHKISQAVAEILEQVSQQGDKALRELSVKFDKHAVETIQLSEAEIIAAADRLPENLKTAIATAKQNISTFHQAQRLNPVSVETMHGVKCEQVVRPVRAVGLYIPGGSAPLFSTVLMLAVPAMIAGCERIVLCSPPPIADEILYAAQLCGVKTVYQIGGAQAIAAMAFGTESVTKVDKIFGPGNSYVTAAKQQVSMHPRGAAIDMPAGPSEVLVMADARANPAFIAADLLSQAEHGPDSQVILLTNSQDMANRACEEVANQLAQLPRQSIATQALAHSRIIVAKDVTEMIEISNQYGPEHLILQLENAEQYVEKITNAGSVFVGDWSPESAGDYASGTNHVLPTYGYTRTYSSLGLADFQKRMTVQQISKQGLANIGATIEIMAEAEQLIAHKNAVTLRLKAINS